MSAYIQLCRQVNTAKVASSPTPIRRRKRNKKRKRESPQSDRRGECPFSASLRLCGELHMSLILAPSSFFFAPSSSAIPAAARVMTPKLARYWK